MVEILDNLANGLFGFGANWGFVIVAFIVFVAIVGYVVWYWLNVVPYKLKANIYTTYAGMNNIPDISRKGDDIEEYGAYVWIGTKKAGLFKDQDGKPYYKIQGYDARLPLAEFKNVLYGNALNLYMSSRLEFHPIPIEMYKQTRTIDGVTREIIVPRMSVLVDDKTINAVLDTIKSKEYRFTWKNWLQANFPLIALLVVTLFAAIALWLMASSLVQNSLITRDASNTLLEAVKIIYNKTVVLPPAPPV